MPRLILLFLFAPFWGLASTPKAIDTIDFEDVQVFYLERLVMEKIDSLRQDQGRFPLYYDPVLQDAARDHARYLSIHGLTSHYQRIPSKRNVLDRVEYYGGQQMVKVGENVLWKRPARLHKWNKRLQRYESFYFYTYNSMANAIVEAWVNSPRHWRTLQIPEFKYTGLAVHVDPDTKEIRVVQVFAQYHNR